MNVQELCWLLADENFPSIETGQEFISWCARRGVDILAETDNQNTIKLFREFRKERLNLLLRKIRSH